MCTGSAIAYKITQKFIIIVFNLWFKVYVIFIIFFYKIKIIFFKHNLIIISITVIAISVMPTANYLDKTTLLSMI